MKKYAFVFVVAVLLVSAAAVLGASVTPTVIPGSSNTDKTCDVRFPGTTELKIEPNNEDTAYNGDTFGDGTLEVTVTKPSSQAGSTNSFDWTSNIPVVAVIVKGGNLGANEYDYGPNGSMGDTYLTTPNDGAQGISNIKWCYYPSTPQYDPLTATKSAHASYDRTIVWTLDKSVSPDMHTGTAGGDAGMSTWTVTADRTDTLGNYVVSGTITINNSNNIPVEFSVSDVLDDGTAASVTCPGDQGDQEPYQVPAMGSVDCSYTAYLSDASATLNTATITSLTDGVGGTTATAAVSFTENVVGDESVTLTDPRVSYTNTISADFSVTFDETFSCPDDTDYTATNTAYLDGDNTDLEASADVDVTCDPVVYAPLTATKSAHASYDRTIVWTLDKSVSPDMHTGTAGGDAGASTWTVTADRTDTLGNYVVSGTITINNSNNIPVDFSVSDVLDDGTAANVTCPSYQVPAMGSVDCSYTAYPSDASATLNTATITSLTDGVGGTTATAAVSFTENVVGDESVTLTDPRVGYSQVISGDTTETFDETFSCPDDTDYTATNTAYLDGDNTDLEASADVDVTCDEDTPPPPPTEPVCEGIPATIWVDEDGIIRIDEQFYGGLPVPRAGQPYDPELGLVGTDRPDVIVGTNLDDRIVGRAANDTICGYGGDDLIYGQEGQDDIWGNEGNDEIRAGASGDDVWGGPGNDLIYLGEGTDYAWGGEGTDTIFGGTGSDHIYGDGDNDILRGGDGDDQMYGGDGDDDIRGQGNNDWMYGEAGNDLLLGGNGADRIYGGEGTDDIRGQNDNDFLYGEAGDGDVLLGGGGDDEMDGGDGVDDRCIGQAGPHDRAVGGCEITNSSTEH